MMHGAQRPNIVNETGGIDIYVAQRAALSYVIRFETDFQVSTRRPYVYTLPILNYDPYTISKSTARLRLNMRQVTTRCLYGFRYSAKA